ncbi:MAG: transglutaminase domain-containing protein [Polyangiales bacterium]
MSALPGRAQTPNARLHVNIPGDTGLRALPPGVLVAPQSEGAMRATAGNGWTDSTRPSDEVLRPRAAWSALVREMDTDTRSPPGYSLRYEEVFTPSIAPFKRVTAYDAVDDLGRLTVRDPSLHPLRVGWSPWPATERTSRFTGDAFIELRPDAPTPVPSVAAEQSVVSYRTVPSVPVAFFTDSARNLYARGDLREARRMRPDLGARSAERAFSPPRVPTSPVGGPSAGVTLPTVPTFLAGESATVLERLGLRAGMPLDVALARLTAHFRAFRDGDLPTAPGSRPYRALALGGVGACRHRAYAFTLTAHALGIPTRYVGNEAHAWVEVLLPGVGWSRVDLGGWNVPFEPRAASERAQHRPENPDVLPQPAGYANGYSNLARPGSRAVVTADAGVAEPPTSPGEPSGNDPAPVDPRSDGANAREANGASGASGGTAGGGTSGGGASTGAVGASGEGEGDGPAASGGAGGGEARAGATRGVEPTEEGVLRAPTRLTLDEVRAVGGAASSHDVLRGTMVRCAGVASDDEGHPVADLPVVIELVHGAARRRPLGTTVTHDDGRWEAQVLVPLDLGPGRYDLRARTAGDATHGPARAE